MADEHTTAPAKPTIGRLAEPELAQLVLDLVGGRIFTSDQLRSLERDLPVVFMPIAFGCFKDFEPEEIGKIGVVYEYLDQAGPRSVNGYPTFMSCRYLHADDWAIVRVRYVTAREAARAAAAGEEVRGG